MKTPTTQPLSLPVRLTRSLRTPIWKKTVSSILLAQFALWSVQVKGATYDWDPAITGGVTLGGAGTWNTSNLNWWNGTSDIAWPNTVDTARFGGTTGGLVTLGSAINVGGLIFNTTGYNIAGGVNALTLAGTGVTNIAVNGFGTSTTIDAQLSGTSGLTKTGNGVLTLTNNSNNFTGNVLVNQGALVVTNQAQLGSGNLVSVNGFSAPNFTGGQLVIQGGVSGLTFSKNLSLAGRGLNLPNSSTGALLNVGQNTFTGNVTFSNASATTALNSYGNATYTGTINVPTGNLALFTGSGNTIVSGLVTGGSATTDRFGKGGGFTLPSTLWLQNANNNYVSDTRIDGGTVRVSTSAALGLQGATATSIDLVNGGIEILTDSPDFSNRTVQVRDFASGTTFVSRALGGSGLNQTVVFGATRGTGAGTTLNVNGRDGYNTTFGNGVANFTGGGGGNAAINNNSSGMLTINSPNIWNQTDGTARTITFAGNGDMVATGNILATGGATSGSGHVFTKAGTGTLTLNATASTFASAANVSAGTLNISTIGALNATSTGRVVFGGGTLNYMGAGETWTSKVLLLNATNNILTNNGSGALILPQNVGNNGTGAKNLVLGGANAGVNDLQGIVVNTTGAAGLTKFDSGTWQISSPGTTVATIGTAGGLTITAVGTTASQTITTASTTGLVVGQPVSGTGVPFGTVISQIISPTQFAISQGATSTGTTVTLGTVTGSTAAFTPTAAAANVLTTSTANLVIGQPVVSAAMPASQGWFISAISGTTITVANTTGAAALVGVAGLVSTTPSASANFAGPLTIAGGAVTLNPLSGTAEVINNSSNVVFAADPIRGSQFAGGTLNYKGFTTGSTEIAGILVPTAGAGRIVVTPGTSGSTNLNFGSLGTRGTGATLNFAPGTGTGIQFMAAPAGLNGQLGGYAYITNPATGSIDYVATPTANTNITALAAATAFPTITGAAATNYLASAGTTTTTGAVAANTVRLAGGSIALGGNLTITSTSATALGGILHDNTAGATSITGAFGIAPSTAGQELVVITGGATPANALTVGSNITGTGSVTKAGTGTLILSGINTFTGALNLNEGTLRASGTSASILGIPAAATVNTTRQGTTFDINAAGASGVPYTAIPALTAAPILISAPIVGSGNITTTAAGDQFIQLGAAGSTSATAILSGVISNGSGTVSVIKNGTAASIQALTGLNTYTGATIISGGMIQANTLANGGVASSIGASTSAASNLVFNGGILQYTGATAQIYQQTQTPSISIDRLFTLAGNGTIDSSGSFGANTLVRAANNAALIFNNTGSVAFAGAGTRSLTLQGDSTGDNEFRTLIGNNPNAVELTSLTKAGSGLWIVSGANTYSGATTISAGALQGVDGVGLPTTSNLTLNGGVFQSSGTFARVLGTGANQVQFGASGGGFSASSAKLTVNLSTGAPLVFGAAPIAGSTLILSSTTALSDVEVVNPLTLGTAARTVQVDDNANSNFDFATLSGVISGAAGGNLTKTGGGTLILNGANNYIGSTTLSGGNVIVQSIGAAGATATSLGTNVGGGALNIGSSGAAGSIIYVGSGETTTRAVNIAGTTGGATIDSSGSGALVLNNVAVTGAGAKTLTIRGVNLDANRISSNLNDNGGILSVTKNDGGIWELTGTNGFTGTLNISGGLLGVNSAAALGASGTGSIEFNNGGLYSTGGPLTIARAIRIGANNSAGFTGPGAFTLSNTVSLVNGNPWTINNTISDPAGLSISGNFVSLDAVGTNRTLTLAGTGNYNLSGVIQPSGGGIQLTVNTANTATTTLSGVSPNLMSATGELRQGILVLDKAQALGLAATTFDLNGGELRTSSAVAAQTQTNIFRLNGSVGLVNGSNPLTMSGSLGVVAASRTLQNDISSPSGLTISGPINLSVDGTITARTLTLSGSGTTNISGIIRNDAAAGAVASSVTYSGSGALNLNGAAANSWTGTAIFNGGTTTVSNGATLGTTAALTVNQAILTLDNTGTSVGARLGNRATTLNGATLNFLGNAAGTTELSTGALTIGTGGTTINNVNIGGNSILTFGSLVATAAGSSVNFTGGVGTATNQVTFTTAPTLTPATTGILARATVAGADFATYGANGITAFTGYTNPADFNTSAATDTVRLNATTTVGALTTNKTVNALAFNAGAPTVSNSTGTMLTVTTGGILTTGAGPYTISARTNLGAEGALHVNTGSTLNINGVLSGAAGLTKNLGGALNLNAANFITGTTTVNGGTTTLSGGLNTLFPGQTLVVNPTATLDLNANSQYVQAFGGGNNPGTGGTITSASAALFSNNGNVAFGGAITGAITMNKTGGSTLTAESPLAYTGDTWITGGTLTLRDNATLLNTAAININYGTLNLDSNANLQIGNNNRVNDAAPITSRGGIITYQARFQAAGTETLGALTLGEGASTINVNAANNAGNNTPFLSAELTLASLTRSAGATVNITSNQGLGIAGNNNRLFFTAAPTTLANGMIGAWAIANSTDFAAYDPTLGVGVFGYSGYAPYSATFGSGNVTQFINNTTPTTTSLSAATTTTGALRLGGVSLNDITFSSGSNTLVLESGGLLRSNQAAGSSIGTTATRGVLTAGTGSAAELVIYSAAAGTTTSAATATTTLNSPVITTVPSTVGLAPGQTITSANFPAGTYIVSIDSPTQITVSQNATAGTATNALITGRDNVVINSVIANNGAGVVTLVKSGAGILNLSANNTYTGGTVINQSTVNLIGSGVVIPAGGITLSGGSLIMNTNAGQIAATNAVNLNDSSTLTLVGNNTLESLSFNNSGGTSNPTVNTGGFLTLTGAAPFTVVSNNVATVPTVNGTVNLTTGVKTLSVGAPQVGGQTISAIAPAINFAGVINGIGTSFNKTGSGLAQFSGQNTFTGGIDLQAGGLVVGAGSSPALGGAGITSGPFGSGAITAASGTTFVSNSTAAFGNAVAFAGTPTFDSTANTVWTLTLNGAISGAGWSATPTVQVSNPNLTVALLGNLPAFTNITKTGPGTLIFNSTNYSGNYDAAALGNPLAVSLLHDGTAPNIGNGVVETVSLGSVTFGTGTGTVTVGRAGGTLPFGTAANKIIAPSSIGGVLSNGLIVANNNGYGLQVSDAGTLASTPTFTVNTATASNVTQGLYLSGALSGSGFNKAGAGTLVLSNAGNTFTGNINVTQGVLSVSSDAQLGTAGNNVRLNPSTGTSTFRATGNITTSRVIDLFASANTRAIEVTSGNTLQLNSAFALTGGVTSSLAKADLGTLRLNANNPSWTGALNINQGAVLIDNNTLTTPAGTGTIFISPAAAVIGAALQLAGGVTVSNPLNLQNTNNILNGGINFGGMLDSVSGNNTYSGPIAHPWDATIGAQAGSTLNLTGLFTATGTHRIQFNSEGNINWSGGQTGALFQIDKYGAGTMNISAPIAGAVSGSGGIQVHKGTLILSGTATTNSSGAANLVQSGAILRLDNATNTNNRLTARAVTLQGGTFDFISNNSTETAGALLIDQGANTINNGGSGTSALTFASLTAPSAGSSLNVTGTFGTATNFVRFTAAPALTPATTGILNRVTVNGNEFASYNATNGIVPFTGYSPATNILGVAATGTFRATSATANSLTGNQTINALTLQSGGLIGNVPNVGGLPGNNPPTTLTITSGSILAQGNGAGVASTLSVPIVAFGGAEALIHVASGQALTITSGMSGTAGLSKNLPGTLSLGAQQFISGTTFVNGGTLSLQSGSTNTLLFNNAVAVNTGGTLDLNGGSQFMAGLSSAAAGGSTGLAGGTVTNSAVGESTLVINSNNNFNGQITGSIYLNKTGVNALNLQSANTYTGNTLITGGTLTLQDDGTILNTPALAINYGTLTLSNGALRDNTNRVSDTAPITMTGGTINFAGRAQANASETLGAVTLVAGNNSIFADDGNVGVGSGTLTLTSIARTVGSTATLRFNNQGDFGLIGTRGRVMVTSAPTLTNNILGPWAIVDREYASYDATYGIGALNQTGFAGYAGSGLNSNPLATDNVRFTTTGTTTLLANTTVGTLNFASQNAATILNLGGNTLTIQGGGLLFGQGTDNVDFSITNGNLTSGVLNSPSDLYLTQANYGGTNRTVTIGAAITDNGTGAVKLIKSGGQNDGNTTLSGLNTYTGGTVVNSGTLTLAATGTLGTGGITVNQATLTQLTGGVIPSQVLNLNGSSTVTLAGNNNLTGITFNNNGGGSPTLTPTGVLTLGAGGITATSINAGTISTIGTGTLDLNANASYPINVGATIVNGVDVAPWQPGLIITSVIQNGGISKTGLGVLQLGGASTFTGGVNVATGGGLALSSDTNSLLLNDPVVTGPVGTGTLTMGANTTMLAISGARTITNNVTFLGDTVFNGTNNLTLNGITTIPSLWNATVTAPQMTVTIGDASPSLATDVINKFGLGTLVIGNYAGTLNIAGGLSFIGDGNTLSTPENINLGGNLVLAGDTAVTVNRSGSAPNSRNKTIQKIDLTTGNILSVSNQSGYGLEFTGTTTITGVSHYSVATATASNLVQGLTLSGVVSDGGSNLNMIKSGVGTLALTNAGNSFGGIGSNIQVLNGILSASSDGALGAAGNGVDLQVDGTTGVGFRATGTFTTGRTFQLNAANNAFEVTAGNVLTLSAPFTLSAATNTLTKNDNGIFAINANNTGWTGAITVNAGALRAGHANALGNGTITVNNAVGSSVQLTGGITFNSPIVIATTGASGYDSRGVIESVSGINTITGLITQNSGIGATIGAAAGATLNINGAIATVNSTTFNAGAGATINLNSVYANGGAGGPTFNKIGTGALNVTVNQSAVAAAINVNQGALNVSGAGVTLGITGLITVNASGTLTIDDTAATAVRLGNRAVTIQGGTFNYLGSTSTETSTGALTFARMGGIYNQTASTSAAVTFGSLAIGADASANFTGAGLGTAANRLMFGTAPTLVGGAVAATNGILARATVNGSTFATYNTNGTTVNTNGIQGFTGYNVTSATNINSAAATDTVDANAAMTTKNLTATKRINALRISGGTAQTVGGAAFNQLTLTAGGILATGAATHVLSMPVLNNAAVQNVIHVDTGSTLNISSTIVGTAGTVKDGAGTLIISSPVSTSGVANVNGNTNTDNVTIARGTVQLAGGTNTLAPGQFLIMGGPASTLDLNGTSQQIAGLFTDTTSPNSGGSITNTSGTTAQLVLNSDARTFAGSISGAVNLVRSGTASTTTFVSANTYTGTTLVNGGTLTVQSDATLSATSAINLNYATLSLDNNAGLNDLTNRINDAAAITLRGGGINFQGRAQTASTETLGAVTLAQGTSSINSVIGGTGINSADLTLTSLTRAVGDGTVNFTALTGGLIGSSSRILIPTINGISTSTAFNALNDGIIGGWAVIGASDWASYVPGLGVGAMGQQGFAQYSNTVTTATTLANSGATDNVNLNTASITSLVNDDLTINSLRFGNVAANTVNIAAGKTLTLESGGLLFFSTAVQTVGAAVNQGNLTSSGPELFVYTQGAGNHVINSVVTGTNSLVKSGANTLNLTGANTYTGGTTVNQGTLNVLATSLIPLATTAANGLILNNGTVNLNAAGAIASGNIVTINSAGSTLNLFGDNTLAGLVLNNNGGGNANLQVNTFSTATATGAGEFGVLTIGASGIVATSSNIASSTIIVGRTDFGATSKTVQVDPIAANGTAISPLIAGLQIQGIVGTAGGVAKTGNGVLQFNAQAHYSGPTDVQAGGIRIGVGNGGSRLSALTLGSGTSLNLAGNSTTWGSLGGAGTVFNSGAAATLTVGFDNTSTTFSGQLARFNDAVINGVAFQKIGTGTLTMTAAQNFASGTTGTITVNGGTLRYVDSGEAFNGTAASGATTITLNNGGMIALDNTGASNVNSRLGLDAIGTLNVQGGRLTINGNAGAGTIETITTFNVLNGGGRVEITPNGSNALQLAITTLNSANGNGTLVVGGINGSAVGTAGQGVLTIATPTLIGGQGTGVNGTVTMPVRHDILGDASATGLGTGFLVRDTTGLSYRALAPSELASAIALPLAVDVDAVTAGNQGAGVLNVGLVGSTQALTVNSFANTLTISGTSTVNSGLGATFGSYGPGGNLLTLSLSNAAASLTLAGATGTINTAFGSFTAGTTPFVHVIAGGTLNVNGAFGFSNAGTTGTAGMAKADGGTLSLNNRAYYTGATTINNGTLRLNSGASNTLAVVPTAGAATVSQVNLNGTGSVLDLMGSNQAIGALTSVNPLPGNGGTVQNTGAAAVLTTMGTGTFSGAITGDLALTRAGNSATTLTNANTYTGATIVRGGVLELRDSGTLASTAGLTLNYGTLNWNNFGLNAAGSPNPTRIAATNAVTLQGGTFTINGAGSTDTTATLNTVTVTGGSNVINTLPYINMGSTVQLTIGNLVRNTATKSGVVFNGFTTNNSTGANTLGGQGLSTNSNIFLNQVNGAAFSATNLVNNLIGGWAVADGSTFATYSNTFGVVAMGNTYGGFTAPAFTGTDVSAALVATGNYNDGTAARALAAGAVVSNSWRFGPGAAQTITFPTTTTASLGVGIITNAAFSTTLAATDATNTLRGTGTDLYFYINQNTTAVQPSIIGTAALVSNGPATLSLRPQFASNTYSGGTFANAGTLNLQAAATFIAIPGDLTINNAAVTMSTTPNQIATTSNVFINGGGSLTFPNYTTGPTQTLASLTFTNDGGNGNPTVTLGTPTVATSTLILSSATPITSTNNSLATTPTISTGSATLTALQFTHANPVLTVNDGLAETELTISAPITQNVAMLSLSKTGTGVLALSGASTFTTGFSLNQGGLMFGVNSTGTLPTVTNGPVGTGTLTIAGGTSLLSDGTLRTIGNATTVNGDFTFAGPVAGNGVILAGAMNLGATGRTINVDSPANTSTISGAITSTATGTALTKSGAGTLLLSSASSNFGGAGVAVTGGILRNGIINAIPTASAVAVSAGAGYDLNGFAQTVDGISGAGFITNSANTAQTLTVSSTANSSTFAGVLTDNILAQSASRLNLTKAGAGTTLTLTGANTYSGVTNVSAGILSITNALALGTTASGTLVTSGGSLELQNNITVTGETLSIAGTGSASNGALRNLSGNNTFAGAVTLTDAASIQSDAGSLILDVPTGNAITATNHNLTFTGAGNTTVADAIAIGSGSLTKTGSGSLTLAATNTYSGKTTIANGTISVGSINALGSNAALDLGVATTSSGRLLYTGGVTTLTKDINALGNGSDTIQNDGSGLLTLSGTLTKAGTTLNLVGGASGILVTGTIVGVPTGSDLVIGNGTTTLQSANSYNGPTILNSGGTLNINHATAISTGALTINGGTLDNTSGAAITLTNNNPLNINSNFTFTGTNSLNLGTGAVTLDANRTVTVTANTLTIGGAISGAFSLTGTGAGTLVLSGASTYTGTTTAVTGSTISVGGNGSLGDTSSGTVIDSGASLALNNVLYTDAEALTINGAGVGNGGAFRTTGTSSFAGPITAASNATINAAGTLSLTGGLVKNGTTLTLGGTGTYNISSTGISGASANSDLVVDAATVNLGVASTYNGPTFIRNGGTINANVTDALPTSISRTAIIMDDSGTGSSTLGLAVNQSVASLTGVATSQVLLGASELTVGASGSGSSVFAGSIAGTGGSIVKDGTNTQTFSGANTYTGTTTLNAGTLNLGSAENAGISGPLGNGGSIVFGGGTLQYSASNQNDYSGRFSTAASQAIRIDTNSQNVTLATALTSSGGSLNKQGAGTLTVTAANTFDAGTTVNGGTLLVNNTTGSGTGSGAVSVSNAGTVLGGNGTIAGDLTVNAGALIAPGSAASTAGTLTIGGSTVVIAGNGVAETRVNFDYTTATGNVPGLTSTTWSSYSGSLLTGNGGQSNDLLNFTATTTSLTWNTGGKISLNQIGSAYSWIQGDVFNLLDWTALGDSGNGLGSIGGSFNSAIDFNLPILSGGLAWDTSRFVTTGAIAVIPEPSRALLMLFGLMALFFRRRRQD